MSESDNFSDHPASAEDLSKVAALLAERQIPAGSEMAKFVLGDLAKHRTKVVVALADGSEATLTFAEVTNVLGHDL